ncbi:hypothetical protein B0H19DRAFT_1083073 [Mycena capillaripes]|nr:hypothetical protein B0H19DRAFT_1083073 [Mycena capillaripes]
MARAMDNPEVNGASRAKILSGTAPNYSRTVDISIPNLRHTDLWISESQTTGHVDECSKDANCEEIDTQISLFDMGTNQLEYFRDLEMKSDETDCENLSELLPTPEIITEASQKLTKLCLGMHRELLMSPCSSFGEWLVLVMLQPSWRCFRILWQLAKPSWTSSVTICQFYA